MKMLLENSKYQRDFNDLPLTGRLFPAMVVFFLILISCNNNKKPAGVEIVNTVEQMDSEVKKIIITSLKYTSSKNGQLNDSTRLLQDSTLIFLYKQKEYTPYWSSKEKWLPRADSLLNFIEQSKLYGLFPSDNHYGQLNKIRENRAA